MKRSAAEMEGGAGEEDEGEEEDEGDAEEEGPEEGEEEREERRYGQQDEGEYADEEEMGEAEDNMEEDMDEHRQNASVKGKEVAHSDDEEYERSAPASVATRVPSGQAKDNEDEEEENMDMDFAKSQAADTAKLIAIMAQFTSEQMSRFECYRRSNFQKSNMRRLLQSVAGCPISIPMTIVMSGIAKMFVGELIETARTVMAERRESGPTRPRHIREAYRRLKLKGKVPLRSRQRLFH